MEAVTMVSSKRAKLKDVADWCTQKETSTRASGTKTKFMGTESSKRSKAADMRACGKIISRTAEAENSGQTGRLTKENTRTE